MIQLTSRQQALLGYLSGMTAYVPVREIAKRFSLSERTIRYDLEVVSAWLKSQGGELVKRPNAGVMIRGGEEVRRKLSSFSGEGAVVKVLSPEERREAIYYQLLFSESAVKAEDLASFLRVSTPTVTNDLHSLGQELRAKQLSIASKKGEGYRLRGGEEELRACLVDALVQLTDDSHAVTRYSLTNRVVRGIHREEHSLRSLALDYLASVDLDALAGLLGYAREVTYHTMPEDGYIRLLLYLAVLVRRASGGNCIPEGKPSGERGEPREEQLAALLIDRLKTRFRLDLGGGEAAQLSRWLISCNIKFPPKTNDKLAERLSSIVDEMLEVLHSYPSYDMPDFYRDKLKMNLMNHLKLTIKKYQLQIPSPNPLLAQMKVNYPEIFTVVYQMAQVFEQGTGIPLDEDEIGFIAIHIAANVEECNRLRSKKALIVCNTGQGAAMVLQNRIRNNIPRLEIQGTLSALDAENMDALAGVDFVISTVEMPPLDKPVFKVSPIISAAEIDRINRYLNGRLSAPGAHENDAGQEYFQSSLARLADRYVRPEDRERFRRELESIVPFTDSGAIQPLGEMTEENIMFQCSMILARVGSALVELGEDCGIQISNDKLFGMIIHILMSIPRWRKGISDREYASEQYKNENIYIYEYLARQLREISSEYGLHIPDKEALALMRYFI
jgi:transcriptional antiterminator